MSVPARSLRQVHCATRQPDGLRAMFQALGAVPLAPSVGMLHVPCAAGATVIFAPRQETPSGLWGVTLEVADLPARQAALTATGIVTEPLPEADGLAAGLRVAAADAGGITVMLRPVGSSGASGGVQAMEQIAAPALRLDHVAVLVRDESAAARTWQAITGVTPHAMGVHPVSGGAFTATRLLLGSQMIELICPVPGKDSALARRLASHGESAVTLALPVADLPAAEAKLAVIGITPLRPAPHVMLHPKDTGGVMIQLTPRVQH